MSINQKAIKRSGSILVVDDEIDSLRLITEILSRQGYRVRPVERPLFALQSALADPPLLILLDVKMQEMDGFELSRQLKQKEQTKDIPIIFVSGLEDFKDKVQGFEAGGVDFISKPFQEAEILARVHSHLQLRHMQLHLEDLVDERTSDLVAANKTMRETRDYLKNLTDSMGDAVISIKIPERIIESFNDSFFMFGYDPEECIGKSTEFLYHDQTDFLSFGESLDEFLREGSKLFQIEQMFERKSGELFHAEITITKNMSEKEVVTLTGIVRDISKRKDAEKALREANLNYRMIADYMYEWEWWKNPDGSFRFVSPACEDITGYSPDQFIKDLSLMKKIIIPEDRAKWEEYKSEREGESCSELKPSEVQFRVRRKDGDIIWIEHACRPVFTQKKEFLGYRATNRNITDRKLVDTKLKESLREIKELKDLYEKESLYLRDEINLEHNYKNIIGNSNALHYVLFKVDEVAKTEASVIILGETGTGKELFARAVHNFSLRSDRPLIKLNCAVLPAHLIESELFGHERGSFTGAAKTHIGRFEVADKSTIFLDEIGELPIELQAKLLRVIEDGEFERLGSTKTLKVDVRIIAATNRDLEKDVSEGRFRQDLWYRLNVYPISLPPLRERVEDIPLIVKYYVDIYARKLGKEIVSVPEKVIKDLQSYSWPGNVRELQNIIERSVIGTSGSKLRFSEKLSKRNQKQSADFKSLDDMERDYIVRVLEKTNWKVSGVNSAAEILRLNRSTLLGKMKKLDIRKP